MFGCWIDGSNAMVVAKHLNPYPGATHTCWVGHMLLHYQLSISCLRCVTNQKCVFKVKGSWHLVVIFCCMILPHYCFTFLCMSSFLAEWLLHLLAELMALGSNLSMPKKLATICCLHDGSLDEESTPQLIKSWGVWCAIRSMWLVHIKEHVWTIGTCPTAYFYLIVGAVRGLQKHFALPQVVMLKQKFGYSCHVTCILLSKLIWEEVAPNKGMKHWKALHSEYCKALLTWCKIR